MPEFIANPHTTIWFTAPVSVRGDVNTSKMISLIKLKKNTRINTNI